MRAVFWLIAMSLVVLGCAAAGEGDSEAQHAEAQGSVQALDATPRQISQPPPTALSIPSGAVSVTGELRGGTTHVWSCADPIGDLETVETGTRRSSAISSSPLDIVSASLSIDQTDGLRAEIELASEIAEALPDELEASWQSFASWNVDILTSPNAIDSEHKVQFHVRHSASFGELVKSSSILTSAGRPIQVVEHGSTVRFEHPASGLPAVILDADELYVFVSAFRSDSFEQVHDACGDEPTNMSGGRGSPTVRVDRAMAVQVASPSQVSVPVPSPSSASASNSGGSALAASAPPVHIEHSWSCVDPVGDPDWIDPAYARSSLDLVAASVSIDHIDGFRAEIQVATPLAEGAASTGSSTSPVFGTSFWDVQVSTSPGYLDSEHAMTITRMHNNFSGDLVKEAAVSDPPDHPGPSVQVVETGSTLQLNHPATHLPDGILNAEELYVMVVAWGTDLANEACGEGSTTDLDVGTPMQRVD